MGGAAEPGRVTDETVRTTAIEPTIVEKAAEATDLSTEAIADALEVIDADLIGRHSRFEASPYVTTGDRRAYAVDPDEWTDLLSSHGLEPALADAVREAHHRQAEALFVASEGDASTLDRSAGIVVGMDTAERFE